MGCAQESPFTTRAIHEQVNNLLTGHLCAGGSEGKFRSALREQGPTNEGEIIFQGADMTVSFMTIPRGFGRSLAGRA